MAQNTKTRSAAVILTVIAALFVGALSLMARGAPWFNAVLAAYSLAWIAAAMFYARRRKWAHIACLGLTLPWTFLLFLQFCRRAFFFIVHSGETPDGTGSPLAFLIGWTIESTLLAFLIILLALLVIDWRITHAN